VGRRYTVHVEASRDLDYINTQVIPVEELEIGPLALLASDSNSTLLTFEHDGTHPTKNAVIAPENAGKPDLPEGATLIDEGLIFVAGMPTLCAAYRPA
jgi:hypothetical protein